MRSRDSVNIIFPNSFRQKSLVHANSVVSPLALCCWELDPRKQYIPTFLKNQHSGLGSGYMRFQFHQQVVTVLSIYAINILLKTSFSPKMSSRLFPTICFIRFSVAGFILDCFDPLSDPIRPASFVENDVLLPIGISSFFIKNKVSTGIWTLVWTFCSIQLTNISAFVPFSCWICYSFTTF